MAPEDKIKYLKDIAEKQIKEEKKRKEEETERERIKKIKRDKDE